MIALFLMWLLSQDEPREFGAHRYQSTEEEIQRNIESNKRQAEIDERYQRKVNESLKSF